MANNASPKAREKNGKALTRWKLPFHLFARSDPNPQIQFGLFFGAGAQGRERQMRQTHG